MDRNQRIGEGLLSLQDAAKRAERVKEDPISFLHRFSDVRDIEIAGWIVSSIAYGQVPVFQATMERILRVMGGKPYEYVMRFDPKTHLADFEPLYYRLNSGKDIACLIYFIQQIIQQFGSVGAAFAAGYRDSDETIADALERFIRRVIELDSSPIYGSRKMPDGLAQFFSLPSRGSACKRLNLYLRWMIRPKDGLDFGLWNQIPPSKLVVPLDTHVFRISRYLGFTRRRTANWTTALEITRALRRFSPEDPLKFDFPLCHHGISGACPVAKAPAQCAVCPLQSACAKGRALVRLMSIKPPDDAADV